MILPTPEQYLIDNPPAGDNGNFTPAQRDAYQNLVLASQVALYGGAVVIALGAVVGGAVAAGGAAAWALE